MDAAEIVHCALQIEKLSADGRCGDILTLLGDLDRSHVTAEQLETTDIVTVLFRLRRTCCDGGVKRLVRSLMSKWKRQCSKERQESRDTELPARVSHAADGGASKQEPPHRSSTQARVSVAEDVDATAGTRPPCSSAFSPVRDKCVQLLLGALCSETPDQDQAAELAGRIERHIHECHEASETKYKACVRSKVSNLRNPKNGHLRQGLLSGSLSPGTFARMSTAEMACAELRRLREEYSSRGVSERQLPQGVEGTQTQKIRCKRCGGSACGVTQVSRGALFLPAWVRPGGPDDDAMTFVTCGGCGQQWYHSGWVCL